MDRLQNGNQAQNGQTKMEWIENGVELAKEKNRWRQVVVAAMVLKDLYNIVVVVVVVVVISNNL